MSTKYRRAYLVEAKRLRLLMACGYDKEQAAAVERLLRARGAW